VPWCFNEDQVSIQFQLDCFDMAEWVIFWHSGWFANWVCDSDSFIYLGFYCKSDHWCNMAETSWGFRFSITLFSLPLSCLMCTYCKNYQMLMHPLMISALPWTVENYHDKLLIIFAWTHFWVHISPLHHSIISATEFHADKVLLITAFLSAWNFFLSYLLLNQSCSCVMLIPSWFHLEYIQ